MTILVREPDPAEDVDSEIEEEEDEPVATDEDEE